MKIPLLKIRSESLTIVLIIDNTLTYYYSDLET